MTFKSKSQLHTRAARAGYARFKERTTTKLTPNQLALMSAILGVSNAGKDDLFRGKHPTYTVDMMRRMFGKPRCPLDVEQIAWDFCSSFAESEAMAEIFVDEAKSWPKTLRKMSVEKIKSTWPEYAPFIECTQ